MQFDILGSLFLGILFIIAFAFLLIIYWQNIRSINKYKKYTLFILRLVTLSMVIFLIINPWFQWSKSIQQKQSLSIYLDSSTSMKSQFLSDKIEINEIRDIIKKWADSKDIGLDWYLFGEKIRPLSIREFGSFEDSITDFSMIPNHSLINNISQSIIISDGQSNKSSGVDQIYFNKGSKVSTVGIGPDQILDDVWIENISYLSEVFVSDSISIKVTLGYNTLINSDGKLSFINLDDSILVPFQIKSGTGYIDIEKSFLGSEILNLSSVEAIIDISEIDKDNNKKPIKISVKDDKKGILLISGSLSSNTSLIKSLIKNLPKHNFIHLYKLNDYDWNIKFNQILSDTTIELVIYDDFPSSNKDISNFKMLEDENKWLNFSEIYFEGPKSNVTTADFISDKFDITTSLVKENYESLIINYYNDNYFYEYFDLNTIPPTRKKMTWNSHQKHILYGFDDGSTAIFKKNNLYAVFVQNIQELILTEKKETESKLEKIINNVFLEAYENNRRLLKINSKQSEYIANYPIVFDVYLSPILNPKEINVLIYDTDDSLVNNTILSENENSTVSQYFSEPGNYSAIAVISSDVDSLKDYQSNLFDFKITRNMIEEKKLFKNRVGLEKLAWNNNGTYTDINHLEKVLESVNTNKNLFLQKFKFSALTIQSYWWILIFLLSLEWFIRKREGLL